MAEETHDPVDLLKASIVESRPAALLTAASEVAPSLSLATYISFPQASGEPVNLTRETPTRYTSQAGSADEFYNISQLWLAWTEKDSGVRDYLVAGQAGGVGYVSVADRRGVVDFLQGTSDGEGRVLGKGQQTGAAAKPSAGLAADALPVTTEAEAGPSRVAQPVKRKYEVDVADREFCKKLRAQEIELRDRNSVLRTQGAGKVNNFESFVKGLMSEKIKAFRKSLEVSGSRSQPAAQQTTDPNRGVKKAKQTAPIIIISSSPTALITMWNVKQFLEEGQFASTDSIKASGQVRAEDMVTILRKRGDVPTKVYVVDSVEALQKFGQDAWDRVICVITTGQEWQFKPYKWQNPKVLFRNVSGVYFQWSNEQTNPAVRDWNVTEMRIDRNKRHTDRQVVADFWRIIDNARKR